MEPQKTDLRVIRTRQAIRKTFYDMIMEMEYPDITIKELAERAMINRNTFYLHYASIDALLEELQDEIADKILSMYVSYENLDDVKIMIRQFFEYIASPDATLLERIVCSGSYRFLAQKINKKVSRHRKETRRGTTGLDEATEDIIFSYYGSIAAVLFRQWVEDDKKLPVEQLIQLATDLLCHGLSSVLGK